VRWICQVWRRVRWKAIIGLWVYQELGRVSWEHLWGPGSEQRAK